jgi:hypothetical protein
MATVRSISFEARAVEGGDATLPHESDWPYCQPTWQNVRSTHILVAGPEKFLRRIKSTCGYLRRRMMRTRRRQLDDGELSRDQHPFTGRYSCFRHASERQQQELDVPRPNRPP